LAIMSNGVSPYLNITLFTQLPMSKVIRLENSTYDELGRFGHWSDTMDSIVRRLLEQVQKQKKMEATIAK